MEYIGKSTNRSRIGIIENNLLITSQTFLIFLIFYLWSRETIFIYAFATLQRLPYVGVLFSYADPTIMTILIFGAISQITKFTRLIDIIIGILIVITSLIVIAVKPEYSVEFVGYSAKFLLSSLPLLYIGLTLPKEIYQLRKSKWIVLFNWLARLSIVAIILYVLVSGTTIVAEWSDDQYHPYLMLPNLIIVIHLLLRRFNFLDLILTILGFGFILVSGNRGPALCLIIYILYELKCKFVKLRLEWKVLILLSTGMLIYLFISGFFIKYIVLIDNFARVNGMSTKITQTFITGEISDSGRSLLWANIFERIVENPFGYGVSSAKYFTGMYSHNFFIDMLLEYGVIYGLTAIILLLWIIFKTQIYTKNDSDMNSILWMLICVSMVKLMVSGYYLTEPYFFVLLGFCIGFSRIMNRYHRVASSTFTNSRI